MLVGPAYAVIDPAPGSEPDWRGAIAAVVAFGLAASGCYVFNDIRDREMDRAHPRKSRRPIASGAVRVPQAIVMAVVLLSASAAVAVGAGVATGVEAAVGLAAVVGLYVVNVTSYSLWAKRVIMLDVVSLALGFVLRVIGGCVAAGIEPSVWLLNTTFFVSMFLAFGKRLGERRTMGEQVAEVRGVQAAYTNNLLRMAVVVTAVATLLTYAGYLQDKAPQFGSGLYLIWLTILPATYGLLRCIVVLESGLYDDPTELAVRDRPFQVAVGVFGLLTVAVLWFERGAEGVGSGIG